MFVKKKKCTYQQLIYRLRCNTTFSYEIFLKTLLASIGFSHTEKFNISLSDSDA